MNERYRLLFEPLQIGPVTTKNRFYAVPHASGFGHLQPNGDIALREMKAQGGWGVVCMSITEISPDSDFANHPMQRLWDASDQPLHERFVERMHEHGALAGVELGHGGARARNLTTGVPVIGPSALPVLRPEVPAQARAMDKRDIRAFRDAHRRAVAAAMNIGYDIVYVYAAHDLSLLQHFLSRRTNQRTDEYGGSLENRARLLREVLEETCEVAAGSCAVALRFSVAEPGAELPIMHDGEGRAVVELLADLPDLWDVNISGWPADSAVSRFAAEGFQEDFVSFVKQVTARPVVGVGRFTSPDTMVSQIRRGVLDLIGAARPSIADPWLPNKIREQREDEIRECIGCNVCVSADAYCIPLRCTQNPTIAEEWRRGWHPEIVPAAGITQSVLVVGGGPAGLECALTLARSGHDVTLAEANGELGGRVTAESQLPGLSAWARVRDYRLHQLRQLPNVELFTDSALDAGQVREFEAARIVLATGAFWRRDGVGSTRFAPVPGLDSIAVLTPDDIQAGGDAGDDVLLYDDDHYYMGGVLAEHLALQGKRVTLVTPLATVSAWTEFTLEQNQVFARLRSLGVRLQCNWRLGKVGADTADFVCAYTGEPVGESVFAGFVMVGARLPNDTLHSELADGDAAAVDSVGDCLVPGSIQAAVYSGHRIARHLSGDPLAGERFRREQARLFEH